MTEDEVRCDEVVAAAWCAVLEVSKALPEDDFFALGGNSLLALDFITRIESRLPIHVPLDALFLGGTLEEIQHACRAADCVPTD